ncbi:MAG TPA: trigger factor [Fibrobacteria bacterium]|nr:trigger factor [Fibrobacteria bacterium]
MKATISEPTTTERVLEIEVERERLDRIFDQKVRKYSKEVRINGFRPGNVPKEVIAKRFKDPINAESLEALIEEVLKEACKEHNIEPIAPGRIDKLENEQGKPIMVKAILEVDPPVEIKDYKLDIPVHGADISDEEVDAQVEGLRKRQAEETQADRAAALGDVVVAQYLAISIGGEAKPLPPRPEFRMELGTSSVPAMDRALIGARAGDEKLVSFTFPADYAQPDFAGKDSEYQLKILEVMEIKLPALDDELAKKFHFDTLDIFRARIREDLAKQSLQKAKEEAYEEAMRRLMETNPFEIPKARIRNYVKYKLEQQGHVHDNDDHGHDHSDLEQEAAFNIRRYRLLEEISKKEKIKPTPEEVDARLKEMAEQYGTDFETLKASLRKSGKILDVREELKSEKTLDFVIGFKREGGA